MVSFVSFVRARSSVFYFPVPFRYSYNNSILDKSELGRQLFSPVFAWEGPRRMPIHGRFHFPTERKNTMKRQIVLD